MATLLLYGRLVNLVAPTQSKSRHVKQRSWAQGFELYGDTSVTPSTAHSQATRPYSQTVLHKIHKQRRIATALSRTPVEQAYKFTTPAQELGALVGFLAAFTSNSLPITIDPSKSVDPDLVLEFNSRIANAEDDVRAAVEATWALNPVVIFADLKSGSPAASREMKHIVDSFKLFPNPTVFDVDQRPDEDVLRPLLERLTGTDVVPLAIIGGETFASLKELRRLQDSGSLEELITAAGAKVNGRKVKRGRKH
ncbi:hypothetical protein EXIGLDRAFT_604107 [Exidia glandulosa HHB12029]|uniref:Uncharacterized protein n=1 Tax=Exidia glandulosa HHB12029 TaxID=1314781 RepID=A0A165NDI3_EXIGL|nr:hypothetical protein EXIGLDRAFT_604107 [Exidia glandulosa HHB12029]